MSTGTKVAIVTGSNKGIGLQIVRELCKKVDGVVFLTARDEKRGKEAVASLEKEGLKPMFHLLDVDSIESIKAFRAFLEKNYGGIDILVHNAAIAYMVEMLKLDPEFIDYEKVPFGEQAEVTNRVNYYGTLNISHELFPLLRKGARVVHLYSSAGSLSWVKGQELRDKFSAPDLTEEKLSSLIESFIKSAKAGTHEAEGWQNSPYSVSKVGVCALTRIQQREMDEKRPGDDIIINSVHPGYVDTDMTYHRGHLTVEQGAVSSIYAALLPPNTKSPRGDFIWHDKTILDWVKDPLPSLY